MRTYEERISELHERANGLAEAKRLRRFCLAAVSLYAAGAAAAIALALGVSRVTRQTAAPGAAYPGSASIFAQGSPFGYVLVMILAFCLGALVTVFCLRLRRVMNKKDPFND